MACNNNYAKSTLVATMYNQTLALNATVPFISSSKTTGSAISLSSDGKTINLKRAGLYEINLSATATGSADATNVTLQINRNGIAPTDGVCSFTPATAEGNAESMSVSTIVEVDTTSGTGYSSIPITITNTGSEAIYNFIIISVVKIA